MTIKILNIIGKNYSRPFNLGRNCTFDRDLCGFTQAKSDAFDWTRIKGATPTSGSGPSRDHTSGTGEVLMTIDAYILNIYTKQ